MSNSRKQGVTYGDQGLPTYGVICNRDLNFVNARINQQYEPTISVKNLINPRLSCGNLKNSFGKYSKTLNAHYKNSFGSDSMWYPNMFIDLNYNPEYGGYIYANGPNGPYFALGLGNYPRSMSKELHFGAQKRGSGRPRKSPKRQASPKRKPSIKYCLPKEQKFPVNTKKKCSAALSYARYAPDPCQIARCVQRNCKKYPMVGTYSKLIKECDEKRKRKSKRH